MKGKLCFSKDISIFFNRLLKTCKVVHLLSKTEPYAEFFHNTEFKWNSLYWQYVVIYLICKELFKGHPTSLDLIYDKEDSIGPITLVLASKKG